MIEAGRQIRVLHLSHSHFSPFLVSWLPSFFLRLSLSLLLETLVNVLPPS
jgi:hypothetical protein